MLSRQRTGIAARLKSVADLQRRDHERQHRTADRLIGWARKTKCRPSPSAVFNDGKPSPDEVELAFTLFAELDADSQAWYGGPGFVDRLRARLLAPR